MTARRAAVAASFLRAAETEPADTALLEAERRVTYGELAQSSARAAAFLARRGAGPGDAVVLAAPNSAAWVAAYLGVLRAGAVAVTLAAAAEGRDIARAARLTGAAIVLAATERVDAIAAACRPAGILVVPIGAGSEPGPDRAGEAIAERAAGEVATVLFTPGVAGAARGVALTHGNLAAAAGDFAVDVAGLGRDDVVAAALPFSDALGQTVALNAPLGAGSTVSLLDHFEPDATLRQLERDAATVFAGTPASCRALLQLARQADAVPSTLDRCLASGAALAPGLLHGFEETFECVVLEGYGLSETAAAGAFNRRHAPRRPGMVGRAMPGAELQVVDRDGRVVEAGEVGEIRIRGDYVMSGYVADPEATARVLRDGWLHTGDLGHLNADGHLAVLGRRDDVLPVGDRTVFARAIEEVLGTHPAVREAAVVGDGGAGIGAAIVLRDAFDIDPRALQRHVRSHLEAHNCPRRIWFVDELPRSSSGKILKHELEGPPEAPGAAV